MKSLKSFQTRIELHTHTPAHTHTLPHVQIMHAWDIIMQLTIRARLESLREALRGAYWQWGHGAGGFVWGLCIPSAHGLGDNSEGRPRHCWSLSLSALMPPSVPASRVMCAALRAPLEGPPPHRGLLFTGSMVCTTGPELGLMLGTCGVEKHFTMGNGLDSARREEVPSAGLFGLRVRFQRSLF